MKSTFSEKKYAVHSVNIEQDDTQQRHDRFRKTVNITLLGVLLIILCLMGLLVREEYYKIITKVNKTVSLGTKKTTQVQETKVSSTPEAKVHPLSDEFIKIVNSKATSWMAGRNFARTSSMDTITRLMGVKKRLPRMDRSILIHSTPTSRTIARNTTEITENFDARDQWPQCSSIRDIRDQGGCGSCWVFAPAETMSDRHCIFTGKSVYFSAEDILSCCDWCINGCNGGNPTEAFIYWKKHGVVSGGPYNSQQGCRPYEIEPCEHHINGSRPQCRSVSNAPVCQKSCQPNYNTTYDDDRHFASSIYMIDIASDEESALKELAINGPMVSEFIVYEDFLSYKSGVYQHVHGDFLGHHAVKVLGYGIEVGVPYYLCANSWNTDWGDRGFFKISRREIFNHFTAGIPLKIPDKSTN